MGAGDAATASAMRLAKADMGSIAGHVAPSRELVQAVGQHVREKGKHLLLDVYLAALDERFQVRACSR